MSSKDKVLSDIRGKIDREIKLIQGFQAVKRNTSNQEVIQRCNNQIRETQTNLDYLRDTLDKLLMQSEDDNDAQQVDSGARSRVVSAEHPLYTRFDLIKYDCPSLGHKIQYMLQQLQFKLQVENQYRSANEKILHLYLMDGDKLSSSAAEGGKFESDQRIQLLNKLLRKYQGMHVNVEEINRDLRIMNTPKFARKPLTGRLTVLITCIRDIDHISLAMSTKKLESFVSIKVDDVEKAKTAPSRIGKFNEEFVVDVDKAHELEITVYDKSGAQNVPVALAWVLLLDIAEEIRKKKVATEMGNDGWIPALSMDQPASAPAHQMPNRGPPMPVGAEPGKVPDPRSVQISAWVNLEPVGQILMNLNFEKTTGVGKTQFMGALGRHGAIRQKKEEVFEQHGHHFVQKQFYNIMCCALCGEFLRYSGYQCQDCRFLCHKKCYQKVVTKCILKLGTSMDDEAKLNHRIPHRFEPVTNRGTKWCCHCGHILPWGRKNVRKCTECGIMCHAQCVHLVPDFCGMSMEMANKILTTIKSTKSNNRLNALPNQRLAPVLPNKAIMANQRLAPVLPNKLNVSSNQRLAPVLPNKPLPVVLGGDYASMQQHQAEQQKQHQQLQQQQQNQQQQQWHQTLPQRDQQFSQHQYSPRPDQQDARQYGQQYNMQHGQQQFGQYFQPENNDQQLLYDQYGVPQHNQMQSVTEVKQEVQYVPQLSPEQIKSHPDDMEEDYSPQLPTQMQNQVQQPVESPYARDAGRRPPPLEKEGEHTLEAEKDTFGNLDYNTQVPELETKKEPKPEHNHHHHHHHRSLKLRRRRRVGLDDFQFLAVLGKGNFGKVMLAESRHTQKLCAIKVLKKDFIVENEEAESVKSEKRVFLTANREMHPFLLNLHCCFQTENRIYFVMEYVSGGDLMWHIQKLRFSAKRAKFYACEVLLALKYFHDNGIVYRDLKLDNILLTTKGHIKIADYGLCKENMWYGNTTATFCGTPEFMAPEIIAGKRYDRSVDWWAFGILMFQMLLCQSPFKGDDEDDIFNAIEHDDVRYPISMPRQTVLILQALLSKDPAERLGAGERDALEIMEHQYFLDVNFDDVLHMRIQPPYLPEVTSDHDYSNFDQEFTSETPRLTPVDTVLTSEMQEQFRGFSHISDDAPV